MKKQSMSLELVPEDAGRPSPGPIFQSLKLGQMAMIMILTKVPP